MANEVYVADGSANGSPQPSPTTISYDDLRARFAGQYGATDVSQQHMLTMARIWYGDDVQVTGEYVPQTVGGARATPSDSGTTTSKGYQILDVTPGAGDTDTIKFIGPGFDAPSITTYGYADAELRQAAVNYATANKIPIFDQMEKERQDLIDKKVYDDLSASGQIRQGQTIYKGSSSGDAIGVNPYAPPRSDDRVFNIDAPVTVIPPGLGGMSFEQSRAYLSQFAPGTPIRSENSPSIFFAWHGGLMDVEGDYLTGWGGSVPTTTPDRFTGIMRGEVYAPPISTGPNGGSSPNVQYGYVPLKTFIPSSVAGKPVAADGSGLMMLSTIPTVSEIVSGVTHTNLNPLDYLKYLNSGVQQKTMIDTATVSAAGAVLGFINNAPRYRADPTDKEGAPDPLHAQEAYNVFTGGMGWINEKIGEVGTGFYNWTVNTSRDLANSDVENGFWGGFAVNERRAALQWLDQNVAAPVATVGDFAARTLQYMNPITAAIFAVGTVGAVGSAIVLSDEVGAKAAIDVYNGRPFEDTTYAKAFNYHIFGADIPYGEPTITGSASKEIPAGTPGYPAGGVETTTTYTQDVYHVPGIGERITNIASNPAAIVGGIAGGAVISGVLRGIGGAGSMGARGGALDAWEAANVGSRESAPTSIRSANSGGGWYNPVTREYTGTVPPTSMVRTTTTSGGATSGAVGAAEGAGYGTIDAMNILIGSGRNVGFTYINPGDIVSGLQITTGAGFVSEIVTGGGSVFDDPEVIVKDYESISREINVPSNIDDYSFGEGYKNVYEPVLNNENDYATGFFDKYGFYPGNAYDNNYRNVYIEDTGLGYDQRVENVNEFVYPNVYAYRNDTSYGYGFGEQAFRPPIYIPGLPPSSGSADTPRTKKGRRGIGWHNVIRNPVLSAGGWEPDWSDLKKHKRSINKPKTGKGRAKEVGRKPWML